MKRFLNIALLMLVVLTANAQGTWTESHKQADELRGEKEQNVCLYDVRGVGTLVVWDWDDPNFRLICEKGIFRAYYNNTLGSFIPLKVGIYDKAGTLTKTYELTMYKENISHGNYISVNRAPILGSKKKVRKIFAALRSGEGYVRMVADRYNDSTFDLKITPFKR